MAFPTLTAENPTADGATGGAATSGSTAAASHSVVLPATVNAGDLLLVFGRVAVAGTVAVTGGGWTIVQDSSDASNDVTFFAWRDTLAAGTEDGTSITVTHASAKMAAYTMAVAGAANPATQAPQSSTVAIGTTTTVNPTACTPTGGAKDYLWIWFGGWDGEQTLSKTGPTSYTDQPDISTGTGGTVDTNAQIKTARRALNAASEDPGACGTLSVAPSGWSAWTIAVHPAPVPSTVAATVGALTLNPVAVTPVPGPVTVAATAGTLTLNPVPGAFLRRLALVAGETRGLSIPGSGARFTSPYSTDIDITDGFIVDIDIDTTVLANNQNVVARWNETAGQFGWICALRSDGKMAITWRNATTGTSLFPIAAAGSFEAGRRTYRFDLDATNGVARFFRGTEWEGALTAFAPVATTAGAVATATNTVGLSVGERWQGGVSQTVGTIYRCRVSKRDGTVLAYFHGPDIRPGTATFTDDTARVWTAVGTATQVHDDATSTATAGVDRVVPFCAPSALAVTATASYDVIAPPITPDPGVASGVANPVTASQGPGSEPAINIEGRRLHQRTGGGGLTKPLTVAVWMRADSTAGSPVFWYQGNEGMADFMLLGLSGGNLAVGTVSGDVVGPAITAGRWYFVAATVTGSDIVLYWREQGSASLSSTSGSLTFTVSNVRLIFGGGQDSSLNWDGQIALGRMWDSVLTGPELLAESKSATDVVAAWGDWPLAPVATSTVDNSGNGRTLSLNGGGSINDHVGPLITVGAVEAAPGTAAAAGQASTPTVTAVSNVTAPAAAANAAGSANNPAVTVAANATADTAAAAGQASDATVSTAGAANAPADTAVATATAADATVAASSNVTATPTAAAATGTANNPTPTLAAAAQPATAVASAAGSDPTISTVSATNAQAGVASATGTAFNIAVSTTISAVAATAIATGQAGQPTVTASGNTFVTPIVAAATGDAYDPSIPGPAVYVPPPVHVTVADRAQTATLIDRDHRVALVDQPQSAAVVDSDHRITVRDDHAETVADPDNTVTVKDPDTRLTLTEG